jgi:hypothetical protein
MLAPSKAAGSAPFQHGFDTGTASQIVPLLPTLRPGVRPAVLSVVEPALVVQVKEIAMVSVATDSVQW